MTDTSTRGERSRRLSRASLKHGALPGLDRLLPAVLVVAAAVQSFAVLRMARSSWFGVDAVHYLTLRGPVPSVNEGLFKPYGGHWQTIPLLVYRGLFATVGMRSYLPYVAVALALHVAIVFVLYALLRSVGARRWTAFGASWLVLFFGAGSEAYLWDAPMVLTSGLLLGMVALLVMVRRRFSWPSRLVGAMLLVAAVMCSGTGLVATVTVGCFVLLRAGLRAALMVGAPAVIAFSVWFFTMGRDGRVSVSGSRIQDLPVFVWHGVTGSLGSLLGIPGTGVVLLATLLVVLVWPVIEAGALRQLALAGMVGAVTQLGLSSFATLTAGPDSARVGRYEYLVLVLLAAALTLGLETVQGLSEQGHSGTGLREALPVVAVLLLAASTLQGVSGERRQEDLGAANARLYRTWVYGSVMAADAGEKQLTLDAGTGFNGGPFELFAQPQLRNNLPDGPATPETRLNAESEYFVSVSGTDPHRFQHTNISVKGLQPSTRLGPGCHALTTDGTGPATIDVRGRRGTEIGISSNSTVVTSQLFRRFVPSTQRAWGVAPGQVYVATSARWATLRVVLNGSGAVSVCHQ